MGVQRRVEETFALSGLARAKLTAFDLCTRKGKLGRPTPIYKKNRDSSSLEGKKESPALHRASSRFRRQDASGAGLLVTIL